MSLLLMISRFKTLMMRKYFYIIILLFVSFMSYSQELQVKSFEDAPTDISAVRHVVYDLNGEPCALVKLGLVLPDAKFEGSILQSEYKDGEWWLYFAAGSKYITIKSDSFPPLRYEFEALLPKMTYIILVDKPIIESGPKGTASIYAYLKNEKSGDKKRSKKDVEVYVDGQKINTSVPCLYEGVVGEHILEIHAPGYNVEKRVFTIETSPIDINVRLVPQGSVEVNGISYEMINVPGGSFYMGTNEEKADEYEKPAHHVTLRPYKIGVTEVSQALWKEIMGSNPALNVGDEKPVENVTFYDVEEFIERLNERCGTDFRLPTEAEWEYAARNCGKDLKSLKSKTMIVDITAGIPDDLGLYHMLGNVAEWCSDFLGKYKNQKEVNPTGPENGVRKIVRGGLSKDSKKFTATARGHQKPSEPSPTIGFRLAMDM